MDVAANPIVVIIMLQFRKRGGYTACIYDKEGLNHDAPTGGGEVEEDDSDYAERKEEEAVRKLKGLYNQYLKGFVECWLGESEEEGETDSESDQSHWGPGDDESEDGSSSDGLESEEVGSLEEDGKGDLSSWKDGY